jgi:nicotinamidase-related amidase
LADRFNLQGKSKVSSKVALLIIDIINDMEFEDAEKLMKQTLRISGNIARLKKSARRAHVPVIYVNDNFGHWQSDFKKQLVHCLTDGVRGEPIVRMLAPEEGDYFVLKPKSSAFFQTTLDTLLRDLGVKTLILTGVAADICILFTAHDAHLRDYKIMVPSDCVASNTKRETVLALKNMEKATRAQICRWQEIPLAALRRGTNPESPRRRKGA